MRSAGALALALLWPAVASGADVFGGYSAMRLGGDNVSGASVAASWPLAGSLRLAAEASAQLGLTDGEDLSEWALLAGPVWTPRRGGRVAPFVHVKAGAVRSRRQIEIFGVAIGPDGVCEGGCPSQTSVAAEVGGGLDVRLGESVALRLPQVDYRLTRLDGDDAKRLRVSAGIVYRFGR